MKNAPIHLDAASAIADRALGAKRLAALGEAEKLVGRPAVSVSGRHGTYAAPILDADGAYVVGVTIYTADQGKGLSA